MQARTLAQIGAEPVIADVFDADAVQTAVKGAQPEVVIEQLTTLPKTYTSQSISAAAELIKCIRLEGGAFVLAAGVRRYIRRSL